ncbi:MAG: phosphoribosylamine--glycine ligase [Candidatus Tectomicrobia bacterium]|nr:phosphoribosylamine--glycine ligase [Candidatus Tectomicrobia bacterium]
MKVLIVGSGGREHALAWKIRQSPRVDALFIAPGNAGTALEGRNVDIQAEDVEGLLRFAEKEDVDLTVVGPEAPLMSGIADRFHAAGRRIFGPTRAAARIEGSKAFAKDLFRRAGVPTALHRAFSTSAEALAYLAGLPEGPRVVKADGLAAGKGVILCGSRSEAERAVRQLMDEGLMGEAGRTVVIEERFTGPELSVFAFCDGPKVAHLASARDHKRVGEGDTGANTGGMGAYSPVPLADERLIQGILDRCHRRAAAALDAAGTPYRGMLYGGVMMTASGEKVLEFNARFGDPETQPVMVRLGEDIVPWLLDVAEGRLQDAKAVRLRDEAAVCVVLASAGYPGTYEKGKRIAGLEAASEMDGVQVFHAGTDRAGREVVTAGGRVLGVTAAGKDLPAAARRAYEAAAQIRWEGVYYRRDIGQGAALL